MCSEKFPKVLKNDFKVFVKFFRKCQQFFTGTFWWQNVLRVEGFGVCLGPADFFLMLWRNSDQFPNTGHKTKLSLFWTCNVANVEFSILKIRMYRGCRILYLLPPPRFDLSKKYFHKRNFVHWGTCARKLAEIAGSNFTPTVSFGRLKSFGRREI